MQYDHTSTFQDMIYIKMDFQISVDILSLPSFSGVNKYQYSHF